MSFKKSDEELAEIYIKSLDRLIKMKMSALDYVAGTIGRDTSLTEAEIINFERKKEEYEKDKFIRSLTPEHYPQGRMAD